MYFLLKRKVGILHFNGHVTYEPKLVAKNHISKIAGTVFIADYFFGGHFGNMQIS